MSPAQRNPDPDRVVVEHSKERLLDAFFKVDRTEVSFSRFDGGMTEPFPFLVLERGDSAAALVHDIDRNRLIVTEQFRYATYEKGPGWMLEAAAGAVQPGEDPADCARREIREELGFDTPILRPVGCVYPSPGGSSERVFLFYAPVRAADLVDPGARGVAAEGEDIRRRELAPTALYRLIDKGRLADAKLVILGQWLRRRKGHSADRRGKARAAGRRRAGKIG